eukprot:g52094.t1
MRRPQYMERVKSNKASPFLPKLLFTSVLKDDQTSSIHPHMEIYTEEGERLKSKMRCAKKAFARPAPWRARSAHTLTAQIRRIGKFELARLREQGRVPGILHNRDHRKGFLYLSFDAHEIERERQTPGFLSRVYYITVKGGLTDLTPTFRAVPLPLTSLTYRGQVNNICFHEFEPGTQHRVTLDVVRVNGRSCVGVRDGGILVTPTPKVQCYWEGGDDIPQAIWVDVADLEVGEAVHLSDIDLPRGLTPVREKDWDLCLASVSGSSKKRRHALGLSLTEEVEKEEVPATPAAPPKEAPKPKETDKDLMKDEEKPKSN